MRDLQLQSMPNDSGILVPALGGARVTAARLCAAGRIAEASVVLSGDLTGGPEDVPLLYELAQIRLRQRDAVGAITLLENAATLAPLDGELHFALATACVRAGRRDRAEAACRLAVQAEPTHGRAHNLLGWLVMEGGDATTALTHFGDALRYDPHSVDVQLNTGTALIRTGNYASARTLCEAMSERAPGHAGVWIQLGLAYKALRDDAAARTAFQRAGASPIAHMQLGQLALVHGDLARGLPLLEARRDLVPAPRPASGPAWRRGERMPRRLLVMHERSMSDTLLMSRFLPLLAARCDRVVAVVQEPLRRLFAQTFPNVEVRSDRGETVVDSWAPILSLPYLLGLDRLEQLSTAPWIDRRHAADSASAAEAPLRIGINWASRLRDPLRSLALETMLPLLRIPGIECVSLHRGVGETEAMRYRLPAPLDGARDWADSAAVIATLDMVVSTATTLPHVSAAMGVPTVVLGSVDPDWRWHGWYHDVTLCPQQSAGEWATVVQRARAVVLTRAPHLRRPSSALRHIA